MNELKYKQYKNKLTSVIRFSEKQYYNNAIKQCNSSVKKTWKLLNNIIKRKNNVSCNNESFIDKDGTLTSNKRKVAQWFQ